jgi:hypothetical protein
VAKYDVLGRYRLIVGVDDAEALRQLDDAPRRGEAAPVRSSMTLPNPREAKTQRRGLYFR